MSEKKGSKERELSWVSQRRAEEKEKEKERKIISDVLEQKKISLRLRH